MRNTYPKDYFKNRAQEEFKKAVGQLVDIQPSEFIWSMEQGYERAFDKIEKIFQDSSIKVLDLTDYWIREIPFEVFNLTNLEELYLNGNDISEIPEQISNLKSLRILRITPTYSREFPLEILNLSSLEELEIGGHPDSFGSALPKLYTLPSKINSLKRLKSLKIMHTRINELPKELFDLTKLEFLYLGFNKIKELSSDISKLVNLKVLRIPANHLTDLPHELAQLQSLEEIDVSNIHLDQHRFLGNQIVRIPIGLRNLPKLKKLDLRGNLIPLAKEILDKPDNPSFILGEYEKILDKIIPSYPAQLFICYSRLDQAKTEEIYQFFMEVGYIPWMDVHDLKGGEIWLEAIEKAIDECELFIAILSNNSVNRRGVLQKELKAALDKWSEMLPDDIYLIPIRLDSCPIPDRLKSFHVLDWEDGKNRDKLLQAIQVGLSKRRK